MNKFAIAIAAAALVAAPSMAQRGPGAGLSEACRAEVQKLCGSATDRDARRACMKENRSKVSDSCKAELKARMEARKEARPEAPAQ